MSASFPLVNICMVTTVLLFYHYSQTRSKSLSQLILLVYYYINCSTIPQPRLSLGPSRTIIKAKKGAQKDFHLEPAGIGLFLWLLASVAFPRVASYLMLTWRHLIFLAIVPQWPLELSYSSTSLCEIKEKAVTLQGATQLCFSDFAQVASALFWVSNFHLTTCGPACCSGMILRHPFLSLGIPIGLIGKAETVVPRWDGGTCCGAPRKQPSSPQTDRNVQLPPGELYSSDNLGLLPTVPRLGLEGSD